MMTGYREPDVVAFASPGSLLGVSNEPPVPHTHSRRQEEVLLLQKATFFLMTGLFLSGVRKWV